MREAHASEKGAIGIDGEMIDAPMLKQVRPEVQFHHSHVTEPPIGGEDHCSRRSCWPAYTNRLIPMDVYGQSGQAVGGLTEMDTREQDVQR